MVIRKANSADIPELERLLGQVGQVHHNIRPDIFRDHAVKYNEGALATLLADERKPIYVAMEGKHMLGYCFCLREIIQNDTALTDRKELYIDDLCVDEACRGKGVATALYRYVVEDAKAQGCDFITLNVWLGNDDAQAFYEKMGLRPRKIMMEMPLEEPKC